MNKTNEEYLNAATLSEETKERLRVFLFHSEFTDKERLAIIKLMEAAYQDGNNDGTSKINLENTKR